jgi:hypothetical protein
MQLHILHCYIYLLLCVSLILTRCKDTCREARNWALCISVLYDYKELIVGIGHVMRDTWNRARAMQAFIIVNVARTRVTDGHYTLLIIN